MTDRRRFLQLLFAASAVASCPKILIPPDAVVEPVLIFHAAPCLLPRTITLAEWDALLWRVQEKHWLKSRQGDAVWTRYA